MKIQLKENSSIEIVNKDGDTIVKVNEDSSVEARGIIYTHHITITPSQGGEATEITFNSTYKYPINNFDLLNMILASNGSIRSELLSMIRIWNSDYSSSEDVAGFHFHKVDTQGKHYLLGWAELIFNPNKVSVNSIDISTDDCSIEDVVTHWYP